jgi:flagellar basal body-associated protein FliL
LVGCQIGVIVMMCETGQMQDRANPRHKVSRIMLVIVIVVVIAVMMVMMRVNLSHCFPLLKNPSLPKFTEDSSGLSTDQRDGGSC